MTVDSRLALPLAESADLSDEDRKFIKAALWRNGATPEITSHEQYARYKKIASELAHKYDIETRSSLAANAAHQSYPASDLGLARGPHL
jgi:hypothetical protein